MADVRDGTTEVFSSIGAAQLAPVQIDQDNSVTIVVAEVNRAVVRQASVGIPDLALDASCIRGQKTGRSEAEQAGYLDEQSAVQQSWKSRL